ncbi:hypothetical protein HDF12_004333 [Edaphobacter lichenicola]|uniref:Uncharacterized protein n=1 Tax=Tunturiibacter lichenicola TaxID=2051959 RepID=A0A7Y9NR02_9BACT|nr:hypothetical protein [Edaphobacter lichenicola]
MPVVNQAFAKKDSRKKKQSAAAFGPAKTDWPVGYRGLVAKGTQT